MLGLSAAQIRSFANKGFLQPARTARRLLFSATTS